MRFRHTAFLAAIFACIALGAAVAASGPATEVANDRQNFTEIARGRYLADVSDCSGCHTAPGGKPYAGGDPIATPFGTLISPNLTPDKATGIGSWTDEQFVDAVQRGGGHLYPAMPYTYFARMPREQILAIRAYLATLDPVTNRVKSNQLPFPFNIRLSMVVWNALFFHPTPITDDPKKAPQWNRGAYLVEGAAHCGVCHTPKNFLGADESGDALQGANLQGWFSPDITEDKQSGIADWSAADIVSYLKIGHNRISFASGPMAEVIADSTSHMTDADLHAVAAYLKDLPAPRQPAVKAIATNDPAMRAGQAIYVDQCSACHAFAGGGEPNIFPALKDSPIVQSMDPTTLIRVVLHGTRNVATAGAPTGAAMPAFGWKLDDRQAAAVITYIRNAWGNAASRVDASQVSKIR